MGSCPGPGYGPQMLPAGHEAGACRAETLLGSAINDPKSHPANQACSTSP